MLTLGLSTRFVKGILEVSDKFSHHRIVSYISLTENGRIPVDAAREMNRYVPPGQEGESAKSIPSAPSGVSWAITAGTPSRLWVDTEDWRMKRPRRR